MNGGPIQVPLSLAGERVDRAVALLTGRTRAEAGRLVDLGGIKIDDGQVGRRSRRLRAGEWLSIDISRLPAGHLPVLKPAPPGSVAFEVIHEAADFLVVDKPAGVVTHPGAGHRDATLAGGLLARYPELAQLPIEGYGEPDRPGIVHRLDKETSGLLAVARSPCGFSSLTAQLAAHTAKRSYVAVVSGGVISQEGVIEGPIGRSEHDPTAMAVVAAGRDARTRYQVRRRYTDPVDATELELRLETGRTHQIRVHLAAIGHPVLGDARYGGSLRSAGVSRLMLHAERLGFLDPLTGEAVEFRAAPPEPFADSLDRFS